MGPYRARLSLSTHLYSCGKHSRHSSKPQKNTFGQLTSIWANKAVPFRNLKTNSMPQNAASPNTENRDHTTLDQQTLQAVLDRVGNPNWDVLIIGDGSGSGWDTSCGWCGLLIDKQTRGRRYAYGGMNAGSVNFAESMPYIQLLSWYDANGGKARLKEQGTLNIHILTDSQVVAHWGNRAMASAVDLPRKHIMLWAGLRELRRLGYMCTFHWSPRMTTQANWACDLIAGLTRREVISANEPGSVAGNASQRAATVIANMRLYDPATGQELNPHFINRDIV